MRSPITIPRRHVLLAIALSALCFGVLGCGRIGGRANEPISGDLYGLDELQRIDAAQWLHLWDGRWSGSKLDLEATGALVPRGVELTLAVLAPRPGSSPDADAGRALGEDLNRALLDVQNQGAVARGVHVELWSTEPGSSLQNELEEMARWVRGVRDSLGDEFELSWTVPWLDPEAILAELKSLRHAVDWYAVRTYGQVAGTADLPGLWDLAGAEDRLLAAREAEVPFRSQIRVGGSIGQRSDRGVTVLATQLTCDAFKELADRSESFFQFEGYFRQVFEADPRLRVLRIGEQELSVGDRLRVNRTTVDHQRKLLSRIEELEIPGHLGHLFLDVASDASDCLSLDIQELALAASPPARWPEVTMERLRRDRYRLILQAGSESTGLARSKHNYVDVIADEGTILDVQMNGFVRFEFIDRQREVSPGLLGTGVRLHVPLLEAGQTAEAVIRTRSHRTGFDLSPRFISPTGRPLPLDDQHWTEASASAASNPGRTGS